MKKSDVLEWINRYDEGDYEVHVQTEDGQDLKITDLTWAGGPWIVVEP